MFYGISIRHGLVCHNARALGLRLLAAKATKGPKGILGVMTQRLRPSYTAVITYTDKLELAPPHIINES